MGNGEKVTKSDQRSTRDKREVTAGRRNALDVIKPNRNRTLDTEVNKNTIRHSYLAPTLPLATCNVP